MPGFPAHGSRGVISDQSLSPGDSVSCSLLGRAVGSWARSWPRDPRKQQSPRGALGVAAGWTQSHAGRREPACPSPTEPRAPGCSDRAHQRSRPRCNVKWAQPGTGGPEGTEASVLGFLGAKKSPWQQLSAQSLTLAAPSRRRARIHAFSCCWERGGGGGHREHGPVCVCTCTDTRAHAEEQGWKGALEVLSSPTPGPRISPVQTSPDACIVQPFSKATVTSDITPGPALGKAGGPWPTSWALKYSPENPG